MDTQDVFDRLIAAYETLERVVEKLTGKSEQPEPADAYRRIETPATQTSAPTVFLASLKRRS